MTCLAIDRGLTRRQRSPSDLERSVFNIHGSPRRTSSDLGGKAGEGFDWHPVCQQTWDAEETEYLVKVRTRRVSRKISYQRVKRPI